ncbi:serine hydrolase [Rhodobacter sp. SGA-6-6]|uniref:serine hydrolase domain-containing protein n=1 Tax=Rhodobacter sp. SGA-6-6 TaxID=2710882 RepID=UPI0013ED261C|nr:serine hydrolase [Rhodobacter sp. SGA-6-6]NGM47161.1 serine hydrolase [Rhodobacter sp. SGA-6-6]
MATDFAARYGFRRAEVTLANWRTAPFSRWAFQNVAELVPSAIRLPADPRPEAPAEDPALLQAPLGAGGTTVAEHLAAHDTDLFCVMKSGRVLADWAAPHADPALPHLVFSISKSLTALLAGALEAEGRLSPGDPVTRFVPEAAGSAFGEASLRHLLDMTTRLDFDEAYLTPDSPFARYRRAMLWNPGTDGLTLLEFLCTIPPLPGGYGDAFRYRSPNSDMLGAMVERAGGARLADLFQERVWTRIGCRGPVALTVDAVGLGRAAGGVSMTARDLARVGEMMRQGGIGPGGRVVPGPWVRDTVEGGDRGQWARGDFPELLPGGAYRNQWYRSGGDWFCAIGIHGQWLAVDPASEVVVVKLSSQAEPVDDDIDQRNIALFEALFRHLG